MSARWARSLWQACGLVVRLDCQMWGVGSRCRQRGAGADPAPAPCRPVWVLPPPSRHVVALAAVAVGPIGITIGKDVHLVSSRLRAVIELGCLGWAVLHIGHWLQRMPVRSASLSRSHLHSPQDETEQQQNGGSSNGGGDPKKGGKPRKEGGAAQVANSVMDKAGVSLGPIGLTVGSELQNLSLDEEDGAGEATRPKSYASLTTEEWRALYEKDGCVDLWVQEEFNSGSRLVVGAGGQGAGVGWRVGQRIRSLRGGWSSLLLCVRPEWGTETASGGAQCVWHVLPALASPGLLLASCLLACWSSGRGRMHPGCSLPPACLHAGAGAAAARTHAPRPPLLSPPQGGSAVYRGGVAGYLSGEGPGLETAQRHKVRITNNFSGEEFEVEVPEDRWV